LSWNQQGVKGDKGDPGTQGQPGPAATAASFYRKTKNVDSAATIDSTVDEGSISCDTGDVLVGGGGFIAGGTDGNGYVATKAGEAQIVSSYPNSLEQWNVGFTIPPSGPGPNGPIIYTM